MPTLEEIRRLSPRALDIYKQQAYRQARAGDPYMSRLVRTPEYQSIMGAPERPWWQHPLDWMRGVEKGAGTVLTAPFTPGVAGTENLPWFEREKAEYEAWDEPSFQTQPLFRLPWTPEEIRQKPWTIGVKGVVEQVPWFATAIASGGLGLLGWTGRTAGIKGLQTAAQVGAKALKPIQAVEGLPGKALGQVGKQIIKKATPVTEQIPDSVRKLVDAIKIAKPAIKETKALRHEERVKRVAEAAGILEKGEGEEAFRASKRALAGTMPTAELEAIRSLMVESDISELFNLIKNADVFYFDKITAERGMQKLLTGQIPQRGELQKLEKIFGSEFAGAVLSRRATSEKVFEIVLGAANLPRAILASFDLSGLLRQGAILSARHPGEAFKTVRPMLKAFMSDKNTQVMDDIIRARPHFAIGEEYGLYIAPIPTKVATRLTEREELFMSQIARAIPGVKQSERAYITVLNDLRSRVWENTLSTWEKTGVKLRVNDYEQLAKLINYASGRGNIEALSALGMSKRAAMGLAPALNATLFSPRLLLSRIQLPGMLFSSSELVRKEAWRTLVQFLGIGTSMLSLLKMGGAEIGLDPRSADFGKAKIGNTRLDIWAGYSQYSRFLTQFVTAQRKTQSGNISEMTRKEVVERFMQSKASPTFGLLIDLLKGETYMGEELALDTKSLSKQAYQRLTPLFIQDMIDAVYQDGMVGGLTAAPSIFGVGVVTYIDEVENMRNNLAQEKYGHIGIMSWEQLGQELGQEAQLEIERGSPELQKKIDERFKKWVGTTDAEYYQQGRLIEKAFQDSVSQSAMRFRATGDGTLFRDEYSKAAYMRRMMYSARDEDERFAIVVEQKKRPMTDQEAKAINPLDIATRKYSEMLYSDDMYDELGVYNFSEADRRKELFKQQFGQRAVDYVENLSGLRWDEPPEVKLLREARRTLEPYWEIETQIWSQYPPELQQIAQQIDIIDRTDPREADRMLFQYPQIVYIRKQIAFYKKRLKAQRPDIAQVLRTFYTY